MAVRNPLGDRKIIVTDDEYCGSFAAIYGALGGKIDSIMQSYTGIIKKLVEDGGLKGQTADKLQAFAETADLLLAQTASELTNQTEKYMNTFVSDLDAADKEIY